MVDLIIRMWKVDNNHQKYDKIVVKWETNSFIQFPQFRKVKNNYLISSHTTRNNTPKVNIEGSIGGGNKERNDKNGVDDRYHRMDGNEIQQGPRETGSRSEAVDPSIDSWQHIYLKKTTSDDDDDDDDDEAYNPCIVQHVNKSIPLILPHRPDTNI